MSTATQTGRDLALMDDLGSRLRNLHRDLKRKYGPALRRLAADDIAGASAARAELRGGCGEGFLEALKWFRRDVEGVVFSLGDPDLYAYWCLGLDGGRLIDGERSDREVMRELTDSGDSDVADQSYLAGKRKALASLIDGPGEVA